MKIKFILTCAPADKIYISPAYWMIRAYYQLRGKHNDQLTWMKPIHDPKLSVQELYDIVMAEQVDVLCLSMYIWNRAQLTQLAARIKQVNPDIIIVAGGPDLDANKNSNFFNEYPFDYVVYGDGEEAFTILLDSIVSKQPLVDACNLVTPTKIWPFRLFADDEFSQRSPWLDLRDEVVATVNQFGSENCVLFYEVARGCPYACSFCDWNNGLHNKVKRRRNNWKDEIDFFAELKVEVRVIDANWGIFKEDVEIHKYAVEKLYFHAFNLPKMNKQVAYDIMSFSYEHFPNELYRVSLQDTNELVLKNIDRPSPPWDEHKRLLHELRAKHPDIRLGAEIIVGLPGQTAESFVDTLIEVEAAGIHEIFENIWMLLPNSPAYNKSYQDKFSIQHDNIIHVTNNFSNYAELNNAVTDGLPGWYITRIVTGSYSADFGDILTMLSLASLYNAIKLKSLKLKWKQIGPRIFPKVREAARAQASQVQQTKAMVVPTENGLVDFHTYYYNSETLKKFL